MEAHADKKQNKKKGVERDGCKPLGVEKALHQTHYLLINWGKQTCALRTTQDIRVDEDIWEILGCFISETFHPETAPEPPPWSLYHIFRTVSKCQ